MNELTNSQKNEVVISNKSIQEVVFNSPKVVNLKESDALGSIIECVGRVYYECGQPISGKDLNLLSTSLQTSISTKFPWITLKEIPLVFSKGRSGDFGDYYGLNLNTFEIWFKKWKSTQRAERMKKHLSEKPVEEMEKPTPDEMKKLIDKHITESCLHFSNTGKILFPYLYNELFKRNKLPNHTKEFKSRIRKKTLERLKSKKENATSYDDMKELAKKIQADDKDLAALMKETVLIEYFSSLQQ